MIKFKVICPDRNSSLFDRPSFFSIDEIEILKGTYYFSDSCYLFDTKKEAQEFIKINIIPRMIEFINKKIKNWEKDIEQWKLNINNNAYPKIWKDFNIRQNINQKDYHPIPDLREFIQEYSSLLKKLKSDECLDLFKHMKLKNRELI